MHVQKFGTFLSNMIMPNIAAIIAWGLITALFIPAGWLAAITMQDPHDGRPDRSTTCSPILIACIVGPMITYLLPLLIGYTGGFG